MGRATHIVLQYIAQAVDLGGKEIVMEANIPGWTPWHPSQLGLPLPPVMMVQGVAHQISPLRIVWILGQWLIWSTAQDTPAQDI